MSHDPSCCVLFEDNHCLALNKPAGMASAHFQGTHETLDRLAKDYLKRKYDKPGNVFLGVVHRLDRPVSGLLLFAKTSKAAARLSEQFRMGSVEKTYWAVVHATQIPDEDLLVDWLLTDKRQGKTIVLRPASPAGKRAVLSYAVRQRWGGLARLELRPETGRRHQLRVQLSCRGWPIFGDKKYGAESEFGGAIALHARSISFDHPVGRERLTLTAPLPAQWLRQFPALSDTPAPQARDSLEP